MSSTKIRQIIFLQSLIALIVTAVSCNSKSTDDEGEIVVTPATVALKKFSLQRNDSVLANLDSVYFSIDLNTGVVFNADSLPKGTDVTRLVPVITFANTMSKADITFLKNNAEDTTVNYLTNATDTIDFSQPVKLDVTAEDGSTSFSYTIKVNVHTMEPDTLMWQLLASSVLPSRFEAPVAQKTVYKDDTAICLIEEYNGEFTLSSCNDLNTGKWDKKQLELPFSPVVASFTDSQEHFWMLSSGNELYNSEDCNIWQKVDENWISIKGGYGDSVLGVKDKEGGYYHAQYPASEDFKETIVEKDFPVYDSSVMGVLDTEWAAKPFSILACGVTEEGKYSSDVWGYDGENWAVINDNYLPALRKPMMARYVVFRETPSLFKVREFDIWLLFGGEKEDGSINKSVYLSYDNGVHWSLAPDLMQWPDNIPILGGADVIVAGYELSSDLSEAWKPQENTKAAPWTRVSFTIDGYDINWICPYLYIFGGYGKDNALSTELWRGVIARLEFTPVI